MRINIAIFLDDVCGWLWECGLVPFSIFVRANRYLSKVLLEEYGYED